MFDLHKVTLSSDNMILPKSDEIYTDASKTTEYFDNLQRDFNDWAEKFGEDAWYAGVGFIQHMADSFNTTLYEEDFLK